MAGAERTMIEWQQGTVPSDDAALHYYRSGGDLPALVMIHGLTDHARYFTRVAAALAHQWDVVAYDARGHGQSSRITDAFDEEIRTRDLVAVIDALGLDRPALVGHSMGGGTISYALAHDPDLSRGAVLEDPAWWDPPEAVRDRWNEGRRQHFAEWKSTLTELRERPFADALEQRRIEEPEWDPTDLATALDGRYAVQTDALDYFCRETRPWRPLVARFTCPTLLLTGDAPGAVVSRADAEAAAALNPRLVLAPIAGAGHHIKYDRFDEYVATVTEFLDPLR